MVLPVELENSARSKFHTFGYDLAPLGEFDDNGVWADDFFVENAAYAIDEDYKRRAENALDFNDFDFMNLAPVACALCYVISMTITKITSDKDNVYTQMIHLYFCALLISLLFYIFTCEGQNNNFTDPTFQFNFRE